MFEINISNPKWIMNFYSIVNRNISTRVCIKIGKRKTEFFWNSHYFILQMRKSRAGKFKMTDIPFWIFPLSFMLNFLVHKIKEQEFQKMFLLFSTLFLYIFDKSPNFCKNQSKRIALGLNRKVNCQNSV